jgi:Dyp-type peroxidase family
VPSAFATLNLFVGSRRAWATISSRQTNPTANQDTMILRGGFSYDRGLCPDGAPDTGRLFLVYLSDPTHQLHPHPTTPVRR